MKRVLTLCLQMKWSIIAFFVALVLGLFGMGLLGLVLYEAVHPLLGPFFGDMEDWEADTAWPALIFAGMGWSFSFIPAGLINIRLEIAGWKKEIRWATYAFVLWLGAVLIWSILFLANEPTGVSVA